MKIVESHKTIYVYSYIIMLQCNPTAHLHNNNVRIPPATKSNMMSITVLSRYVHVFIA